MSSYQVDMLLEEIQQAAACRYLSDLPFYRAFSSRTRQLILGIPDDKYTLGEWQKAVAYIIGSPCKCGTVSEAKKKITSR